MTFSNYNEIIIQALSANQQNYRRAANAIGLKPTVFREVLLGSDPSVKTVQKLIAYFAYQQLKKIS